MFAGVQTGDCLLPSMDDAPAALIVDLRMAGLDTVTPSEQCAACL